MGLSSHLVWLDPFRDGVLTMVCVSKRASWMSTRSFASGKHKMSIERNAENAVKGDCRACIYAKFEKSGARMGVSGCGYVAHLAHEQVHRFTEQTLLALASLGRCSFKKT